MAVTLPVNQKENSTRERPRGPEMKGQDQPGADRLEQCGAEAVPGKSPDEHQISGWHGAGGEGWVYGIRNLELGRST